MLRVRVNVMGLIGELHPKSKLTNDQVVSIRQLYRQGASIKLLAKRYKVSAWNIKSIVTYKTWKHIIVQK